MRVGADADQLDATAAALAQGADLLDQIRATLNSRIHHAPWKGHQGAEFRQDWDRVYYPRLVNAAVYLREARAVVLRNADEQRHASDSGGGSMNRAGVSAHHASPDELAQLLRVLGVVSPLVLSLDLFAFVLGSGRDKLIDSALHAIGDAGDAYKIARYFGHLPGSDFFDDVLRKTGVISFGWDGLKFVRDLSSGHATDALFDLGHLALDTVNIFVGTKVKLVLAGATLLWDLGASRVGHAIENLAAGAAHDGFRVAGAAGAAELHVAHRLANDMFSAPAGAVRFLRRRL